MLRRTPAFAVPEPGTSTAFARYHRARTPGHERTCSVHNAVRGHPTVKQTLFRAGLEALYFSGSHLLLRPFFGGMGAILSFQHVRPRASRDGFQPNRRLEITPQFFERVIKTLRNSNIDIISLGEMHRRFVEADFSGRFVCLTFDGGYRDTRIWAYPILKKHAAPFAIYAPTSFLDRVGELWWRVLEAVIANHVRIALMIDGRDRRFECATLRDKKHLFSELYRWLTTLPTNDDILSVVHDLAGRYGVDMSAINGLCMSWQEIAELVADPLVTIGANTVNCPILAKSPEETVVSELKMSRAVIEAAIGVRPEHLAYPFGDRDSTGPREFRLAAQLGFKTATTTRPGMLFPEHRDYLTALPRITIDGDRQQNRYVRVLLSGAATAVRNRFQDLEVA
jgi:peptidoglycan/xylan/chitin deacetylase (PgdA/CDA1 family)